MLCNDQVFTVAHLSQIMGKTQRCNPPVSKVSRVVAKLTLMEEIRTKIKQKRPVCDAKSGKPNLFPLSLFAEGMKFTTHISPLLNFEYSYLIVTRLLTKNFD